MNFALLFMTCLFVNLGYDGTCNEWDDYSRYMNQDGVEMPPVSFSVPPQHFSLCILVLYSWT